MHPNPVTTNNSNEEEEENFSFQQFIKNWIANLAFALRFWKLIFAAGIIGTLLGITYSYIKKSTYTAKLTFVVEESKTSGGSIASALAGQVGLDIGSLTGGSSGILAGDNVLELLKSSSLLKKTLLSPYKDSSTASLADLYADSYQMKEAWQNAKKVGRLVNFPTNQKQFSRLEDSLLQKIVQRIIESELSISKPDKKLGIFEMQVTTRNELLSQLICERLLKNTTDFYVETKTRRLTNNINRLQHRADSLGILLDRKTYSTAEANKLLLDANPAYSVPTVDAEISSRNKMIQGTVYAEIIKNLEISKTSLIQETPTVQVVDSPEMPLKKNELKWWLAGFIGGLIGLTTSILFFALQKRN